MAATAVPVKFKRRKVFAVRDFPAGCGPNALAAACRRSPANGPLTEPLPPTEPVLPLKDPKMEPVESGGVAKDTNNGPQPSAKEVAPEKSKGGLVAEPACVRMMVQVNQKRCYPMFFPPPKRRKVSCVRDYPAGCGPNASPLSRGESLEVIAAADAPSVSIVGEGGDGERLPLKSNEDQLKGALKSSLGAKASEKKLEGLDEMRIEAPVKSALKSSLDGRTTGERWEKLPAGSTSQKKLEVHEEKQLCKIIRVKEEQESEPSVDAKSQSGSEVVKEGKQSMVERGLVKYESEVAIPKRKFSEKEEGKWQVATSQTKGNSDLAVHDDRMTVQALMAASNCPWSQSSKSGEFSFHSLTPKNNVKKGRKSIRNTAVKGASISPLKIKMVAEDEEDPVLVGEEGEVALVVYNRSPENSVTMPPLAPPKQDHRDGNEELSVRSKVKRTLRLFHFLTRKLLQEVESRKDSGRVRVDLKAAEILKKKNECVNCGKPIFGHVPGVEIGDEFRYRVELSIVGLHRPYQGGIDFAKIDGMVLATSIVASGGYADVANSTDVLIYSGSGGNPVGGDKQAGDQKLERGNLALKNSIDARTPVRVIHGFKELKGSELDPKVKVVSTFAYDGLYVVEKYWTERGHRGNSVFMFQLRRMGGQPELALKEVKKSNKSKVREGICIEDISERKEIIPICAVNTIDDDKPMPFNYTTRNMYPSWCVHTLPSGCDCIFGCSDSSNCACAAKNGGEIPFNYNGAIVQAKPLVYECGPSCRCPPSCQNRVTQHGIRVPLEIFKTESRGWGVRSLHSIPSGSFICEYIGELLKDSEAEHRSNDEYLFDIGHNYQDKTLWEGLPSLIPGLHASSSCDTVDDAGFTIDAAAYGNIGRFINHSCSPNIYAQNVLYDHDDKRMPHIMFFAADNIPPLQELTYHYNYTVDQVYDSEGNIKRKSCYCGAPECTGRLY